MDGPQIISTNVPFDGLGGIKRESSAAEDGASVLNQQHVSLGPSPRRPEPAANGFHTEPEQADGLAGICGGGKATKIQQIVEDAASPESRRTVDLILGQVQQLTTAEKLLLYLKLPTGRSGCSGSTDPLRQPLNPLGTRFEIQQTITWIKTHLTEDPDISLPKQDVYDEYLTYCGTNQMKPLSTADFGKVMKQVFPRVRPRRLGTRGNSRYCYAGLCKRMRLDRPLLPDLGEDAPRIESLQGSEDGEENTDAAASFLIREWAQKLLSQSFGSLKELACHLVEKMCVDTRSVAAFSFLSSTNEGKQRQHQPKRVGAPSSASTSPSPSVPMLASSGSIPSKHREAQMQLQRKLQEREVIREQKRKLQDTVPGSASQTPEGPRTPVSRPSSSCKKAKLVSKVANGRSSADTASQPPSASPVPVRSKGEGKKRQQTPTELPLVNGPSSSKDPSPNSLPLTPTVSSKMPIPRLSSNKQPSNKYIIISPPETKPKPGRKKYKLIQPKPSTATSDTPTKNESQARFFTGESEPVIPSEPAVSIPSLERYALDDYLHGGNSQEQEEELMLYFQQSGEAAPSPPQPPTPVPAPVPPLTPGGPMSEEPATDKKISQLRLLLERNLSKHGESESSTSLPPRVLPGTSNNTRRRVSFETSTISTDGCQQQQHQQQQQHVPPSPNTRRRIFSFTPISPDTAVTVPPNLVSSGPPPPSPAAPPKSSMSTSANGSPFVSPRNTPVPRSRHNSGQAAQPSQFVFPQTNVMPFTRVRHSSNGGANGGGSSRGASALTRTRQLPSTAVNRAGANGSSGSSNLVYSLSSNSQLFTPSSSNQILEDQNPLDSNNLSEPLSPMLHKNNVGSILESVLSPNHLRHRHLSAGHQLHLPSGGTLLSSQAAVSVSLEQAMKSNYLDSLSQEVSAYLSSDPSLSAMPMPQFRSQSVPLHQMATPGYFMGLTSAGSSVAPTPVPSEFADFLDTSTDTFQELDCEQLNQFIMETDLLEPTPPLAPQASDIPDEPLTLRTFSSRSYPNTPVPDLGHSSGLGLDGGGLQEATSRSYPSTPVVAPSSDPLLMSHLTLNALNLNTGIDMHSFGSARRNITELLDHEQPSFLMEEFVECESEFSSFVQEVEGSSLNE